MAASNLNNLNSVSHEIDISMNGDAPNKEQTHLTLKILEKSSYFENDHSPIMLKYNNYECRFNSFTKWDHYDKAIAEWLARCGFYFTKDIKNHANAVICFDCGRFNSTKSTYAELLELPDDDNQIQAYYYHYGHCKFVNSLIEQGDSWFKDSYKLDKPLSKKEITANMKSAHSTMATVPEWRKNVEEIHRNDFGKTSFKPSSEVELCIICNKEKVGVRYLPCDHMKCCVRCSKDTELCCFCYEPYSAVIRE